MPAGSWLQKAGLGGVPALGSVALSPRVPLARAPWDLFALREEGNRGLLPSGQGQAAESCCLATGGARRGPAGLVRSGQIPGFSSTGRYCTKQEEVPTGEEGNQARPLFALSHTQGLWVSSRTGPFRRAVENPSGFSISLMVPFSPTTGHGGGSCPVRLVAHSCLF